MKRFMLGAILALAIVPVALAGNLPAANTGTIALGDDVSLTLGGHAEFYADWSGHLNNPRVEVLCYQGEKLVYGEATGDSGYGRFHGHEFDFPLLGAASSFWVESGGPAECVANLYYFKVQGTNKEWSGSGQQETVYLASVGFSAS